jgi:transcriptional regulator with XRE-family HTH domain
MTPIKGQIVPSVKDYSSKAIVAGLMHKRAMRELMTPAEFEELFVARTKALRVHAGMTAQQMATALGVPFERYKKYESRTPLPHELIEQFALITRVSVEFVMTGRRVGAGPHPDVPGPHMLDEWRASKAEGITAPKRGRPKKSN